MGNKDPDRSLNRFSTILEIFTNLGQIGSWVLGAGAAYVLNIQQFPVVIPGINFTLDVYFQFTLVLCSTLAYIHFLQGYWFRNKARLFLSDSFLEFLFWDLPILKQPMLLIPIILIFAVWGRVADESIVLSVVLQFITGGLLIFTVGMVLSRLPSAIKPDASKIPQENLEQGWRGDGEWAEKWIRRIRTKLNAQGSVSIEDFYESGMIRTRQSHQAEISFALRQYFDKFEFEEYLILIEADQLPYRHPKYNIFSSKWVLLTRENINSYRR